jgi:hypothetical protein
MTELTGIKLRMTSEPVELRAQFRPGHPLTEELSGQWAGIRETVSPAFYADDPDATVIGTFLGGRAAIAIKPQRGWTAVYSCVPMLPASLLRRLAALAGVHQYIETEDVVWASRDMLAVSVYKAGTRRIRLPQKAAMRDLYTREEVVRAADSFDAPFASYATRVFVREDPTLRNL